MEFITESSSAQAIAERGKFHFFWQPVKREGQQTCHSELDSESFEGNAYNLLISPPNHLPQFEN